MVRNNRISTTISPRHHTMLMKLAEKHGSQQKALEFALDSLKNESKSTSRWSPEEERCARMNMELKSLCLIDKDFLKVLLDNLNEEQMLSYLKERSPNQYMIEYHLRKPLKDCSLKEIIEILYLNASTSNWFDTADCTDESSYYTFNISHSLGLNNSKTVLAGIENMFKTYGVKTESTISERTVHIRIYKNAHQL